MADNKGDAVTAVSDETEQKPEEPAGNDKSASVEGNGDVAFVGDGGDSEAKRTKQETEEKSAGDGGDSEAKQPKQVPEEKSVPLHAKIVKQVEFYFGDYNLSRDRFLKEQVQLDDGWISSEIMLKFNRLKNICADWDVIVEALKDYSDLVQISADGTKVRRNPSRPLPGDSKERRDEIQSRTIYANRFPLDTKLDDLMDFFDSYGPVEHIFMKRDFHKHTFKGSVFVTYKTKADAEEFLREEGTKFKDAPLEVKQWKADYFKSKSSKKDKSSKNNAGSKHE
ncbi:lupus la protein homolog [Plakobranchus ocellatus]|uniref:Lupus la protein homolog n=1 Tax=Plakobranchus ocellatus TaxID=259542 RepID=A0AAV4CEV3_9GAST|nr:lupus la protein homolog [Plakobranchus ocellatus]